MPKQAVADGIVSRWYKVEEIQLSVPAWDDCTRIPEGYGTKGNSSGSFGMRLL